MFHLGVWGIFFIGVDGLKLSANYNNGIQWLLIFKKDCNNFPLTELSFAAP